MRRRNILNELINQVIMNSNIFSVFFSSAAPTERVTAWTGPNMKSLKAKFRKTDVSVTRVHVHIPAARYARVCLCGWVSVCVCAVGVWLTADFLNLWGQQAKPRLVDILLPQGKWINRIIMLVQSVRAFLRPRVNRDCSISHVSLSAAMKRLMRWGSRGWEKRDGWC